MHSKDASAALQLDFTADFPSRRWTHLRSLWRLTPPAFDHIRKPFITFSHLHASLALWPFGQRGHPLTPFCSPFPVSLWVALLGHDSLLLMGRLRNDC